MCRITAIIFFFSISFGVSQESITGVIIDKNNAPIPYVNIGIPSQGVGTVSDQDGKYLIDFAESDDSIKISAIGYKDIMVSYKSLLEESSILLTEEAYLLNTVEISARKLNDKMIRIGSRNDKRGHSMGFGSKQLGAEIGAVLRFKKPTSIHSAHFVVNHAKGDSMLFRVKIYNVNNGIVSNQILKENVLIRDKQQKGTIKVDLSQLQLNLQGDYLLSLEWVQDMDGKGNEGITFDTKSERKNGGTYLKMSSVGHFKKISYLKNKRPCFYILWKETLSD